MEGYYIGLGCDLFGYRECRRGHGTSLLVLFIEPHGSELTDNGWVWLKGKIVIGHGKNVRFGEIYQGKKVVNHIGKTMVRLYYLEMAMVAREPRLVQSRFDWHQESYKGGISLNGVSLNTFTSLVVWRYQRKDLQTFEEAGKGVQLILSGHGGFEACGLGLVLSWRLRGDLPGLEMDGTK
ncbi:hypothetical protein YC2023_122344 [Brassica napus]